MSGFALSTNVPPRYLRDTALATAEGLGFKTVSDSEWSFRAAKGSIGTALLAGGLFVAYCRFHLSVTVGPNGVSQLTLDRNSPAWTGIAGVSRVKTRARQFAETVAAALASQGAAVYEVRPY